MLSLLLRRIEGFIPQVQEEQLIPIKQFSLALSLLNTQRTYFQPFSLAPKNTNCFLQLVTFLFISTKHVHTQSILLSLTPTPIHAGHRHL